MKTVIKNNSNNGVTHEVEIKLDGTVIAKKFIEGELSQTYDWSYMSKEEVYQTAKESGHQEYIIIEEDEKFLQEMTAATIRHDIERATRWIEEEVEVRFVPSDEDGYIEVSLIVEDENGEYLVDELVASVRSSNPATYEKAEKMAARLNKKYGTNN